MQYDNTNHGILFKNNKRTKDTQPNYTGNINIAGKEYPLSAWVKEKNGKKYISLSINERKENENRQQNYNQD